MSPLLACNRGLDKKMMFTLNTLADSGRTVVLTTHAANNIIGQCDHVAFMAHGRLVYYGPPTHKFNFSTPLISPISTQSLKNPRMQSAGSKPTGRPLSGKNLWSTGENDKPSRKAAGLAAGPRTYPH